MMCLAPAIAQELAARAAAFKAQLEEQKVRVYERDYTELAMLSILPQRPPQS